MAGAVFARVGHDSDGGLSVQRQVEEVKRYAAEHNIEVVQVFEQVGPARLDDLIEGVRQGHYDTVLTRSIDRLSRNSEECFMNLLKIKALGGKVHFTSTGTVME